MANLTSIVLANPRGLMADDGGAVDAAVTAFPDWQPTQVLETDFSAVLGTTGLAAAGDLWHITVCPPSAIPGQLFYPIAHRLQIRCNDDANFDALFAATAAYSINPTFGKYETWTHCALDAVVRVYDSTTTLRVRTLNPEFHGFPVRANGTSSATVAQNALAGFCLEIGTWDATAAAATIVCVDTRFLGFSVNVDKSAGFYMPRQYFTPQ